MTTPDLANMLREMADWDHRGDTMQERWDEIYGAGSFDAALAEVERLRAQAPAAEPQWRPIADAPEGELVVVGWVDGADIEQPDRHDFDWLEDGCWSRHHDNAEHVEMIGGHGVSYTAPYTHFVRLAPLPTA